MRELPLARSASFSVWAFCLTALMMLSAGDRAFNSLCAVASAEPRGASSLLTEVAMRHIFVMDNTESLSGSD